jgi:hypothetical protein
MKKKKYSQLAIVHFNNCGPEIRKFTSTRPIAIHQVAAHLEVEDGFNDDVDSLTFVDSVITEKI